MFRDWYLTSWSELLMAVLVLAAAYSLLGMLRSLLRSGWRPRYGDTFLRALTRRAGVLFPPLALAILTAIFIMIDPPLHGLMVLLLLLLMLRHLRRYVSGLVLKLDTQLVRGRPLQFAGTRGILEEWGLTGAYLRVSGGRIFAPFDRLSLEGYSIGTDLGAGGTHELVIDLPENEPREDSYQRLIARLLTSPYTDGHLYSDIEDIGDYHDGRVELTVRVRQADHLDHLLTALQEAGYRAGLTTS